MKRLGENCAGKEMKLGLLIFITVVSWFIFPLMLKQLNPMVFQIGFAICLLSVSAVVVLTATRNQLALQSLQKIMLACWVGYLFALLLATLESASTYSLLQWCFLVAKFLFFLFLLLYLNSKYIVATMRIYANLMVATVFFALVAILLPANGISPFTTVDLGGRLGHVFLGAYIVYTDFICPPLPIFRVQGLSEEPGTYAFALLPAFFWLLIAEKAYMRATVIVLGLMFSYSLGVGLFLLMLTPLMLRKYFPSYKVPVFFLGAVCVIGLMYVVSSYCRVSHLEKVGESSAALMVTREGGREVVNHAEFRVAINTKLSEARKVEPAIFHADMGAGKNDIAKIKSVLNANNESVESKSKDAGAPPQESVPLIQESIEASLDNKILSLQDRINGLFAVSGYFKDHLMGTGAALGMLTVKNSISVGYAVAILESGVIGGIFYLGLFSIMGWLALKTIVASHYGSFDERVRIVVALSVCTILVMGAQRMQPDLSWWHMWIYAMWFYLLQNGQFNETGQNQVAAGQVIKIRT